MHSRILRIDAPQYAGRETGGAGHAPRCARRRDRASVKLVTLILIVALQKPPLPVAAGELRPPDPRGSLAKGNRRVHDRGCGPRPHYPQRLSHRTQGRVPAQAQQAAAVERRRRLRERVPCRTAPASIGRVLWSYGRALRASPRPAGRVDKPWTRAGASPTALTTLACFSPTGTTGQPQHRFFQYSDSSGLTAGEKGAPAAPGPRERTTVIACTAVFEIRWGSLVLAAGWPAASLPASKRRTEPGFSPGETCALTREPVRQM